MTGMFTSLNASASSSSSGPSTNPVPPLPSLFNPAKLKDLSTTRLTDSNFRAWRNIVQSEFDYYGIEGIINGNHGLPTDPTCLQYWKQIERLFNMKFASSFYSMGVNQSQTYTAREMACYPLSLYT